MVFAAGCSKGGGGSTQSSDDTGNNNTTAGAKVTLSGTIGSGFTLAGAMRENSPVRPSPFSSEASAAALPIIDKILAVSLQTHGLLISEATFTNNAFSLDVDKGAPQLLVFLNGTTNIGIYQADAGTGLDAFPLKTATTGSIDLGAVSFDSALKRMTGTLNGTGLLSALGIDQGLAKAFGLMDNGLMRLSSLDVDGNGVLDATESRYMDFGIAYSFNSSETPTALMGAFASPQAVAPQGYTFMYHDNGPYSSGTNSALLNWSLATLTTPTAIDGLTLWPVCQDVNCWNVDAQGSAGLNFVDYLNAQGLPSPLFTTPSTPPTGTYVINVPYSSGTGTQTFTFNNVQSRAIEANMYDVYVPSLKLTMDNSNHVSLIEWQWWKRQSSDGVWVQPTDAELAMVLDGNGYHLCSFNMGTECVNGTIGFTTTGSVVPPAQSFALFDVMVMYWEKSGYHYGFDWR